MLVHVRVQPNSAREGIEKEGDVLVVKVSAPPRAGKANRRLIELLSKYYGVPKSGIEIIRGAKSRDKVVKIKLEREKR